MEDMSVLTTDENLMTLLYSSESQLGKQVLGYVQGVNDDLRTIDVVETQLGDTVWVTLADGLNKSLGELFSMRAGELPDDTDSASFSTDDWLKVIENNPAVLRKPIAIKGKEFLQVENRSEILKFFGVDSAGLEKKNVGEEPTTSSTTDDESFV